MKSCCKFHSPFHKWNYCELFCTVQEGLMFTAQEGQVAWLGQQEVGTYNTYIIYLDKSLLSSLVKLSS